MKMLFLLMLIGISASCQQQSSNVSSLPADSFKMELKNNPGVLLDVRTPEEFAEEHIPGAINLDYNNPDFESTLDSLDKNLKYDIYCRSGRRSSDAIEMMQKKGFNKVTHLEGGILEWKQEGFETEK